MSGESAQASSDDRPVGGGCLCGAVRFTIRLPTMFCAHCHCSMCRRNHGAPYVTWFGIARERLALDAGGDVLRVHQSSEHGTRSFCARCGSSLFCESTHHPDHVDVVLASLDGPIDRAPAMHVFFDSRADWVDVRDGLLRLGGASGVEPLPAEAGETRPGVWVGHVALPVPDVRAAAAFFAALGMRPLEEEAEFALLELRGGTHLALFPGEAAAPGTPAPFDLMVDDLEQARSRLLAKGLSPSEIGSGRFHRELTVVAPSGHVMSVLSSHVSNRPV